MIAPRYDTGTRHEPRFAQRLRTWSTYLASLLTDIYRRQAYRNQYAVHRYVRTALGQNSRKCQRLPKVLARTAHRDELILKLQDTVTRLTGQDSYYLLCRMGH